MIAPGIIDMSLGFCENGCGGITSIYAVQANEIGNNFCYGDLSAACLKV
jgi:hypothetical protein